MNFQIGDKVRVASKGKTGDEHGMGFGRQWQNSWAPSMDSNIGLVFTVKDIDPFLGVFFEEYDSDTLNGKGSYGYPINVLERVELTSV